MASGIKSGIPVILREVQNNSSFFKLGQSLRVTGKLASFEVETGFIIISDGDVTLRIDTQHLKDLNFRTGSWYHFIGELIMGPDDDAMLEARVGRNADGLDLNLYQQTLQLRRKFESDHLRR